MADVIKFLKANGFKKSKSEKNSYTNEKCTISVYKPAGIITEGFYQVKFAQDGHYGNMYSRELNIYWLIGVLTYYNLMKKNYNAIWKKVKKKNS